MSKAIGVKVDGFYATDYAGVVEAQRFNKIQVAWYGNKSAIEAVTGPAANSSPSPSILTGAPAITPI